VTTGDDKMDKKWISIGVVSVIIVSLTVAVVSARLLTMNSLLVHVENGTGQ
jgi:hypothetical protein